MIDINPEDKNKNPHTAQIVNEVKQLLAFDPVAARIIRLHLNLHYAMKDDHAVKEATENANATLMSTIKENI